MLIVVGATPAHAQNQPFYKRGRVRCECASQLSELQKPTFLKVIESYPLCARTMKWNALVTGRKKKEEKEL
jgi:hypothetical protein